MAEKPTYEELEQRVLQLEQQLADGISMVDDAGDDLQRLYNVFHLLPAYVYLQADDYTIHFANRKFVEIFGDPEGRLCHQIFKCIDQPCEPCRTFEVFDTDQAIVREWTDDSGRSFVIYDTLFPGTIEGKRLVMEVGIEITWRKKLEAQLLQSEEDLIRAQTIARIGSWEWEVATDGVYWSDGMFQVFGIDKQVPTFELARTLVHPEDRRFWEDSVAAAVERKEPITIDYRAQRPDGKLIWIRNESEVLLDEDGRVTKYVGTSQDVTERKEAEEALRESEERFRTLVEQAAEGIFVHDLDGRFRDVNAVACEKLGYTRDELLSLAVKDVDPDFVARDDPTRYWLDLEYRAPVIVRSRHRRKDGSAYPVEVSLNPITARGERLVLAFARDISDRVRAEQEKAALESQLRQSHKMEAIGTMAGGIAHDFNNILGVIVGNAELAMDEIPSYSEAHGNLSEITDAAIRARDIVKQLLAYIRRSEHELQPIVVKRVMREALKLISHSLSKTISIETSLRLGHERVLADATQLHQVLMNLCSNAAHAMQPAGGTLTVAAECTEITAGQGLSLKPGNYVKIEVADTGKGIPGEIVERIFDPYFTTKEVGSGSGMGLAVVHGIIQGWSGVIKVKSSVGQGTTFTLLLPITTEKSEAEEAGKLPAIGGSERILFIDDEPRLATMVKRLLESLGYRVEALTDPLEALELFRENPAAFDAVITDMTMPGMTGDRLSMELIAIRPGLPVILCSGYSDLMDEDKARELGMGAFLAKPLRREVLARTLRAVIGGSADD